MQRRASDAIAERSSSPPSMRYGRGIAASHSWVYINGLFVWPMSTATRRVFAEATHWPAHPWRHLGERRLEDDAGRECPVVSEMLSERSDRV